MAVVDEIARLSVWIVVGAVVVSIVSQVALFISAIVELRRIRLRDRHQLWRRMLSSPLAPKITILVPAYNEEVAVGETGYLTIYDLGGRRVRTLLSGVQQAGPGRTTWDGRDDSGRGAATGIYLFRFESPTFHRAGQPPNNASPSSVASGTRRRCFPAARLSQA